MRAKGKTTSAVAILHQRYVKGDPARKAALEAARVQAEVARTIYKLRTEAGMTQAQLAKLAGTTQSVSVRCGDSVVLAVRRAGCARTARARTLHFVQDRLCATGGGQMRRGSRIRRPWADGSVACADDLGARPRLRDW
jgi:hypothetical protein